VTPSQVILHVHIPQRNHSKQSLPNATTHMFTFPPLGSVHMAIWQVGWDSGHKVSAQGLCGPRSSSEDSHRTWDTDPHVGRRTAHLSPIGTFGKGSRTTASATRQNDSKKHQSLTRVITASCIKHLPSSCAVINFTRSHPNRQFPNDRGTS
jgi:hypothetical protein